MVKNFEENSFRPLANLQTNNFPKQDTLPSLDYQHFIKYI